MGNFPLNFRLKRLIVRENVSIFFSGPLFVGWIIASSGKRLGIRAIFNSAIGIQYTTGD